METRYLIRLGAAALLLSGVLYAVAAPFHPDDSDPGALLNPAWSVVHTALLVVFALAGLGIVGLYVRLADRTGRLGRIAFSLALFGTILTTGAIVLEVYALPILAPYQAGPKSLTAALSWPAAQVALPFVGLSLLIWAIGYIALGVAVWRSGVLPRFAGLALIAGTVLSLAPILVVKVAGNELTALALIWLGVALLQTQATGHPAAATDGLTARRAS